MPSSPAHALRTPSLAHTHPSRALALPAPARRHYANRFAVFAGDNSSGATPSIPGLDPQNPQWNNHWYSYNVGLVHFVAMSSEAYFSYAGKEIQYAWIDADLSAVNRSVTPWVVVYGHRSVYCSCDSDCDGAADALRDGKFGMEGLLNRHKVDLWLNAHGAWVGGASPLSFFPHTHPLCPPRALTLYARTHTNTPPRRPRARL